MDCKRWLDFADLRWRGCAILPSAAPMFAGRWSVVFEIVRSCVRLLLYGEAGSVGCDEQKGQVSGCCTYSELTYHSYCNCIYSTVVIVIYYQ